MKLPNLSTPEMLLLMDHGTRRDVLVAGILTDLVWRGSLKLVGRGDERLAQDLLWQGFGLAKGRNFSTDVFQAHEQLVLDKGMGKEGMEVELEGFLTAIWSFVWEDSIRKPIEQELEQKLEKRMDRVKGGDPRNPFGKNYKGGAFPRFWLRLQQMLGLISRTGDPDLEDVRSEVEAEYRLRVSRVSEGFGLVVETRPYRAWRMLKDLGGMLWFQPFLDDRLLVDLHEWTREEGENARSELDAVGVEPDFVELFSEAKVDEVGMVRDMCLAFFKERYMSVAGVERVPTWWDVGLEGMGFLGEG